MTFSKKITITVAEVVPIQVFVFTVGSKQKIKMNSQNTMASSYNSKVGSTPSNGVPFFPCLCHGKWYYITSCLRKGKLFADNSNLTNLFEVQSLHENGRWIKYVSDGFYTLFNKRSCCSTLLYQNVSFITELRYLKFSKVQLFLSHQPWIEARCDFYSFDHDQEKVPFLSNYYWLPPKKSTSRKIMLTILTISPILSVSEWTSLNSFG